MIDTNDFSKSILIAIGIPPNKVYNWSNLLFVKCFSLQMFQMSCIV